MTSSVPAVIAWPVIIFMVITLAARFRWCRTNLYDTYYNNLMVFIMLAQLLREHEVEVAMSSSGLLSVSTAQQLASAAMIFASTEFIGFTTLWTRLSPAETRRGHRLYRVAAVLLGLAFLGAATRARVSGQVLEVSGGWDAVLAWSAYVAMILVVAARVSWMFAAELRTSTQRREFLLAIGGLSLGVVTGAGALEGLILAVADQLGWAHTLKFRLWFHGFEFFSIALVIFILGAVPLAARLVCYLGLDPTSRTWNRLEPMRLSMTAVVPESSFNLDHEDCRFQKTTLQLHQTVIEIRDVILQLRPYLRDIPRHELAWFFEAYSVPTKEREVAAHALELTQAARAKTASATPESPDVTTMVRSRSRTLNEEVAELLALAKWWKVASAAAEQFTPSAPEVEASAPT
jgi:hypothetical protein